MIVWMLDNFVIGLYTLIAKRLVAISGIPHAMLPVIMAENGNQVARPVPRRGAVTAPSPMRGWGQGTKLLQE